MNETPRYLVRLGNQQEFGPADLEHLQQWAREGRVPVDALLVPEGGGEEIPVLDRPELAVILKAPPTTPGVRTISRSAGEESIATLIPYRNGPALAGYYVAIGSLIPLIGLIAGPVAMWLGAFGLRKRKADPNVHGLAHAWIAIIGGAIGTLISVGCLGSMFIGAFTA